MIEYALTRISVGKASALIKPTQVDMGDIVSLIVITQVTSGTATRHTWLCVSAAKARAEIAAQINETIRMPRNSKGSVARIPTIGAMLAITLSVAGSIFEPDASIN